MSINSIQLKANWIALYNANLQHTFSSHGVTLTIQIYPDIYDRILVTFYTFNRRDVEVHLYVQTADKDGVFAYRDNAHVTIVGGPSGKKTNYWYEINGPAGQETVRNGDPGPTMRGKGKSAGIDVVGSLPAELKNCVLEFIRRLYQNTWSHF